MAFYDRIDIIDQIKACRRQLNDLVQENQTLTNELEVQTKQANAVSKEYNNIAHYETITSYLTSDDQKLITDGKLNVLRIFDGNAKHNELNAKLELSILNENIKEVLPRLQELARRNQTDAWVTDDQNKSQRKQQVTTKSIVTKSIDEIQREIKEMISLKKALDSQVEAEIASQRDHHFKLSRAVASLRREINDLVNERDDYKAAMLKYKWSVRDEENRQDYLHQQLELVKSKIGQHHLDKHSWMTEAFLVECQGDFDGRVKFDRLANILDLWLPALEVVDGTVNAVVEMCAFSRQTENLNYDQFIEFCKQSEALLTSQTQK